MKLKKCQFAKQEIHYLGHILSNCGVHTDPEKVKAVLQWPVPTNVRELRGFLGLAGFYRKFVKHLLLLPNRLLLCSRKILSLSGRLSISKLFIPFNRLCAQPRSWLFQISQSLLLSKQTLRRLAWALYSCSVVTLSRMSANLLVSRHKACPCTKKSISPY